MTTQAAEMPLTAAPESKLERRKDPAFEAFRGLAILVTVNGHAHIAGFAFANADVGQWNYWYSLAVRQLELFAVPLFLFVSGYLSGDVRYRSVWDYGSFLRRRLSRIMIPYLVWSVIFISLYLWMDKALTPGNFMLRLAIGGGDGPYYFIVVLFQCYLLAPLFSRLAEQKYGAAVVVAAHLSFLAFVSYLRFNVFTADSYLGMPVFIFFSWPCLTWFTFFYLGIVCRRYPDWTRRIPLPLLASSMAIMYVVMNMESCLLVRAGYHEIATCTYRISCYFYSVPLVLTLFKLRNATWPRLLVHSGEYTFGIFFLHMFLLRALESQARHIGPLYAIQPVYQLFTTAVVLALCIAAVTAGRKVLGRERAAKWLGF